jgi:5-methylcytosine-specific restriction protein A
MSKRQLTYWQRVRQKFDASRTKVTRPPSRRPSASAQGYDRRWRKRARIKLARDPWCEHPRCHDPANEVDHIVSKRQGGTDEWSNLQSLCGFHHKQKTAREDGAFGRAPVQRRAMEL